MKKKLLVYEFDCLNSLLLTDNTILSKIFSCIVIPQIAFDEFKRKISGNIQDTVNDLLNNKFIILQDFEVESQEYVLYKKLIKGIDCKTIGKHESAAITMAKFNDLTILSTSTHDYLREFNVNYICIADLIFNHYINENISMAEAEILWNNLSLYCEKLLSNSFNQFLSLKNMTV